MKLRPILFIASILISISSLNAQDAFHYTLFDFAGVAMNPALAGNFEGTARAGGLFREQDHGLQIGQYRNPIFYLDAPIIRGFGKRDWVGLGMYYMYDQQRYDEFVDDTNIDLITTKIFGGVSYHIALDKKYRHILSLGVQSGNANAYFSRADVVMYTELGDEPRQDPIENALPIKNPQGGGNNTSTGRINYIAGLHFKSQISELSNFNIGLSIANIGRISNSIAGQGGTSFLPWRFLVHSTYKTPIADRVSIEPRVMFQYMKPSWELEFQAISHFNLNPEKGTSVGGGLGYNIQNGLQLLITADVKNFRIGYSFDLNLTDKAAVSGASSAFELGVSYILKFYKKPNPDPVLICPSI